MKEKIIVGAVRGLLISATLVCSSIAGNLWADIIKDRIKRRVIRKEANRAMKEQAKTSS